MSALERGRDVARMARKLAAEARHEARHFEAKARELGEHDDAPEGAKYATLGREQRLTAKALDCYAALHTAGYGGRS